MAMEVRISERRAVAGQYMVEFGLTFGFFIFIILAMINLIIAGYNYDTVQRATWEASRKAALGRSNAEVAAIIHNEWVSRYVGTTLMMADVDFNPNEFIEPIEEVDRVEGSPVTVRLDYIVGFSLGIFRAVQVPFRVQSTLFVAAHNDEDRDNRADDWERDPGDFDNDTILDLSEVDLDGDMGSNIPDTSDWGIIFLDTTTDLVVLVLSNGTSKNPGALQEGKFVARQMWITDSGDTVYSPYPLRPRQLPYDQIANVSHPVMVDLRHDADNDGWEFKFDLDDNNDAVGLGRNLQWY